MIRRPHRLAALWLAGALCGCASAPTPENAAAPADLKVYQLAELTGRSYENLGYVWVDSWRSAFRLPTEPAQDDAIASLRAEAARRGADGLVNLVCLDQNVPRSPKDGEPGFLCYANAIRLKRGEG